MDIDNTESQMRKGLLELCILWYYTTAERKHTPAIYWKQLKGAKLVVIGRHFIPLLTRLKKCRHAQLPVGRECIWAAEKNIFHYKKRVKFYEQLRTTWDDLSKAVNDLTVPL